MSNVHSGLEMSVVSEKLSVVSRRSRVKEQCPHHLALTLKFDYRFPMTTSLKPPNRNRTPLAAFGDSYLESAAGPWLLAP